MWEAARDVPSVVYLTVGTGIGRGAVLDGLPIHGALHPEMGHLLPRRHPDDRFAGICPFHGDCVEGLASGPALAARRERPAEQLDEADRREALTIEASYLAQLVAAVTLIVSPHRDWATAPASSAPSPSPPTHGHLSLARPVAGPDHVGNERRAREEAEVLDSRHQTSLRLAGPKPGETPETAQPTQ